MRTVGMRGVAETTVIALNHMALWICLCPLIFKETVDSFIL